MISIVRTTGRAGRVALARGFSLIELMIVVAIVALLASIAYPAYTSSILKGKRAEGRAALLELMQQQERYLSQNGSYMTFGSGATGANGATKDVTSGVAIPFKTHSGETRSSAAYLLSAAECQNSDGTSQARNECVLLTATMTGSGDSEYGNLTLKSTGEKSCTTTNTANKAKCWAR